VLNNFTLLCVEDDLDAQKHIKMMLEDDFKELYMASDGLEGLKIFQEKNPDIIITDINMPNMDGLSMIKEIKKIDRSQPIVIISAFDDRENLLEAINMGGNGFISKPIDMDLLYKKLDCIAQTLQDNIEAQKLKDKEMSNLYKLAHYDTLTNIPNRFLFEITLDKAISKAKRDKKELAIFFIDLDGFKNINDTYGHEVGDIVLKTVSRNIKDVIRSEDTLARRSGDEFLLLVEGISSKDALELLAKKIIDASSQPIKHPGGVLSITSSIGISRFPYDADMADKLMHFADIAMYEAKKCGKCRHVFYNSSV